MSNLIQNIELKGCNLPKLSSLREKGRQAFERQGLPTAKTEAWKYTKVREIEEADFTIKPATDLQNCDEHCSCHNQTLPFEAYEIKFCNGKLASNHLHLPSDIEVSSILDAFDDNQAAEYINKSFDMNHLPFAALNTAYLEQGIFLRIPRNVKIDKPIALINHTQTEIKTFANIRNVIILENGAEAQIVEYYNYSGELKSEYFNNIVNEIYIGRNASLKHYKAQNEAYKAIHIALNTAKIKENGKYESFTLQKGANLARHETLASLKEENAQAIINATYVINGWACVDTTTNIEHLAPNTQSHQLVKGVIDGQAKGVFQGKIHIAPLAIKTQGYQLHKAILLSDSAEVDVKPELEIFADDVKCSHGATSGDLDAEQLFYLRSRGIGEQEAKNLLIRAFVDDVINQIDDPLIKDWFLSF